MRAAARPGVPCAVRARGLAARHLEHLEHLGAFEPGPLGQLLIGDAFARAFIYVEIAKFFGFVPALEGGFDYFALSDDGADATNTVPILGVGIRRTEF